MRLKIDQNPIMYRTRSKIYKLFELLKAHGHYMEYEEIYQKVWGGTYRRVDSSVKIDILMRSRRQLRKEVS